MVITTQTGRVVVGAWPDNKLNESYVQVSFCLPLLLRLWCT